MDINAFFSTEPIKTIAGPLLTAILAYLVGNRVSAYWDYKKKRRELSIISMKEFNNCYGQFYTLWKKWNYTIKDENCTDERKISIMDEVLKMEANMETLFITIANERRLSIKEKKYLGQFRQAFQQLRNHIKKKEELDWSYQDIHDYRSFKILAIYVGRIVSDLGNGKKPTEKEAEKNLFMITSGEWERKWKISMENEGK